MIPTHDSTSLSYITCSPTDQTSPRTTMSQQQLLRRNLLSVLPKSKSSAIQSKNGQTNESQERENRCDLDPAAYICLKSNSFKENLKALDSIRFRKDCSANDMHLDVGCGPGGFLQEHLLPRLRPCKRVVGVDVCPSMLEFAERDCRQPEVSFDLLNIEHGDPQAILDTYGQFDRLYSFLTFHYVSDLEKAYRNVYRLLKDAGEGLIIYFVRTDITDMFQRVYDMGNWSQYMPDLRERFAERFCFNASVPEEEVAEQEKRALAEARLELVSCRFHPSQWTFPSLDDCLDLYISFCKMDAKIPKEKRDLFRNDCKTLLAESSSTADGSCILKHSAVVVHFWKPAHNEE